MYGALASNNIDVYTYKRVTEKMRGRKKALNIVKWKERKDSWINASINKIIPNHIYIMFLIYIMNHDVTITNP